MSNRTQVVIACISSIIGIAFLMIYFRHNWMLGFLGGCLVVLNYIRFLGKLKN